MMTLKLLQQNLIEEMEWVKDAKKGQPLGKRTVLGVLMRYEIQERSINETIFSNKLYSA